jgi:hypothetical protein
MLADRVETQPVRAVKRISASKRTAEVRSRAFANSSSAERQSAWKS